MAVFVISIVKLPPPSKSPVKLVCHWFKGNVRSGLCNKVQLAPAVPLVAEMDNVVPLKLMLVICGDNNGRMICLGLKTAATKALAVGFGLAGSVQEYEMVSEPALSPDI